MTNFVARGGAWLLCLLLVVSPLSVGCREQSVAVQPPAEANASDVDFRSTKLTDAGLVDFKGLKKLKYLDLSHTEVTDSGLVHLNGLKKMKYLRLNGTKVTDAGLVHLKGLTKLQWLHLENTKVTDAGVKDLQVTLPECSITR